MVKILEQLQSDNKEIAWKFKFLFTQLLHKKIALQVTDTTYPGLMQAQEGVLRFL